MTKTERERLRFRLYLAQRDFAAAWDEAEYLRVIEHRAFGDSEATSRFEWRIALAEKRLQEAKRLLEV